MDLEMKKVLQEDFEAYMYKYFNEFKRFDLESFSNFSSTILNYYVNNKAILSEDKKVAAYFLTTLYNKGIGNRISEEHLQLIAQTIASDYSIDFKVIQMLYN